jgi:ribosome production factor 2
MSSSSSKKSPTESELIERTKNILFLKGRQASELVQNAMRNLTSLSKPNCKSLNRKNDIVPFEDVNSIEFLSSKNDCGLFVMGSHTKKRPHNLVIVSCQ